MCGRFTFDIPPELLAAIFGLRDVPEVTTSYNVAPTQLSPIVRQVSDHNSLVPMKWGLVPSWAKDPAIGSQMINARTETVTEKPSFRHAIKYRRCIVPAGGFFEWRHEGKNKIPMYIHRKDGSPLGLAGIWEEWKAPDGSLLDTFAILTTTANKLIESIHDRMPVILAPGDYPTWLNSHLTDPGQLKPLYQPFPADLLAAYPVSDRVNTPRNNSHENIRKRAPEIGATPSEH
jgi:putative SOS response-associated peptidase YedK